MAQTRTGRPGMKVNGNTRTKTRSGAAKPQNKAAKPTRPRGTSKTAGRASRNGSRAGATTGSPRSTPRRAKQSSNGHGGVEAAKTALADATSGAGDSIRSAAKGAKGPLLAGSAALAGLAGGVVLGAARGPAGVIGAKPRKVAFQIRSQDLATTAKAIGSFGEQLGMVAAEIRRTREAAAASKHRSPVEVVLQGLTARR
jgi:hypothetical protein